MHLHVCSNIHQSRHILNLLKIRTKQIFCFAVKFEQLQTHWYSADIIIVHSLFKILTDFCFFSDLLSQNSGLTVAILDALSNLCLRPDLLAEVRLIYIVFQVLCDQASKECRQWNLRIDFMLLIETLLLVNFNRSEHRSQKCCLLLKWMTCQWL